MSNKKKNRKWYSCKVAVAFWFFVILLAGAYLVKTWPYNFAGKIVYRMLGKAMPGSDLAKIRQFLLAKRTLDRKDYKSAQTVLEDLRAKVSPNFLFFKEIYLYLGYIYDVSGDYRKELSLYKELEGKDIVFSKFMYGLYFSRHGNVKSARALFTEALLLDNKLHRLGIAYRGKLERILLKEIPNRTNPSGN